MLNCDVKRHLLLKVKRLFVLLMAAQTNNVANRETTNQEK